MNYINSPLPFMEYKEAAAAHLFVDKSNLIDEVVEAMEDGLRYQCITRPRRFGKSYGANMVASFFMKDDSIKEFFASQKIGASERAMKYCGEYNVVYLSGAQTTNDDLDGEANKEIIRTALIQDLQELFPDVPISPDKKLSEAYRNILRMHKDAKLVVVMDEWDYFLNRVGISENDVRTYIGFLRDMLKDQPIIKLAYFTGILPMPIFSSLSDLNMFIQYNLSESTRFSTCFGFTEEEVDELYQRYLSTKSHPRITREDLKDWYEGYTCADGVSIYNPQSVVAALSNDRLDDYWCQSGATNEIFSAIANNVQSVQTEIGNLASKLPVSIHLLLKKNQITSGARKDAVLSKMVALGFLSYADGNARVPNKELMIEFSNMILEQSELDYIHKLAIKSSEILQAVLDLRSDIVASALEYVHDTETPLLQYNRESDLVTVVNMAFINARNKYDVRREDQGGIGFVDFIFYPYNLLEDVIILELKVDDTSENALKQVKDRKYALRFEGKFGEVSHYRGRIIGVGIAYDKKTKKHACTIEVLRGRIIC